MITPLQPVDREKLFALVAAKTIFSKSQFERLLGHEFGDAASVEMKMLARDLIELPIELQRKIKEIQLGFPQVKIEAIR